MLAIAAKPSHACLFPKQCWSDRTSRGSVRMLCEDCRKIIITKWKQAKHLERARAKRKDLTAADRQAILTALDNGARPVDVANDYLVTVARIYQIRKRAA